MILLIDTSTERSFVALIDNGEILFEQQFPMGLRSSRALIPAIRQGLDDLSLAPHDLSAVAVGVGPGSYTGIRVGVAAAKCLALALERALVGVCSLVGFVPEQDGPFASVIDAKSGGVYVMQGRLLDGKLVRRSEPELCPLEAFAVPPETLLVTPSAKSLRERLLIQFPQHQWQWLERAPSVAHFAQAAQEKIAQGGLSQGDELEILYLR